MIDMVTEFLRRSRSRYSPGQVKEALKDNLSIVTDDGFICFNIVQDECFVLFAYTRPGADFKPFKLAMEFYARSHGCRYVKFTTKREKGFQKLLPDYHPAERVFEKELV